jgi:peptidoglycan/xylan/chitin deacetylase (PgdA/CDA1 family)
MANSLEYARHQQAEGIRATYFIQTKYVRDWNDDAFFNSQGIENLKALLGLGAEIGSHSVSHSRVFSSFALGSGDERYPAYRPFVRDAEHTSGGTILGELRVSRFLLERVAGAPAPVSFRPGYLDLPFSLPQALEATGYRYSSSQSANQSLTHLPFRLAYDRGTQAQSAVYEFPITIEDELPPRMGERLPQALALAERLARYGGLFVVLTHPDVLDHKLEFQKGLVRALKGRAAFASLNEFGAWWVARDQATWRVTKERARRTLTLEAPTPIEGLPLRVPAGYRYVGAEPATEVRQSGRTLIVARARGRLTLQFQAE